MDSWLDMLQVPDRVLGRGQVLGMDTLRQMTMPRPLGRLTFPLQMERHNHHSQGSLRDTHRGTLHDSLRDSPHGIHHDAQSRDSPHGVHHDAQSRDSPHGVHRDAQSRAPHNVPPGDRQNVLPSLQIHLLFLSITNRPFGTLENGYLLYCMHDKRPMNGRMNTFMKSAI
jgi:hypothetical protein